MTSSVIRRRRADTLPIFTRFFVLAICLLGFCLGGAVERWSQGTMLILLGLLLFCDPPRRWSDRTLLGVLGGCFALILLGFAPASWVPSPQWRQNFAGLGLVLPDTISPQPWLSAEALLLFTGAALWTCWLNAQDWPAGARASLIRGFGGGAVLLAATALALYFWKANPSFWSAPSGFGPFPNRNHTSNFLALGGIVALACAHDRWRHRRITWIFWTAGWLTILAALIINWSRAGIILLLGGAAGWLAMLCCWAASKRRIAVGASVFIVLLSLFLLFGGDTLGRFKNEFGGEYGLFGSRGLIFHDTLRMISAAPWLGVGLRNFRQIFPVFRDASTAENTIAHPESDWLWLAAELGWPGLVLVVAGFLLLLRRAFPFRNETERRLRAGAWVAAIAFAGHSVVDVAGHRYGAVLPALFLLNVAACPARWRRENPPLREARTDRQRRGAVMDETRTGGLPAERRSLGESECPDAFAASERAEHAGGEWPRAGEARPQSASFFLGVLRVLRGSNSPHRVTSRWAPRAFRLAALPLLLVGGIWIWASWTAFPLPGALGVALAKSGAFQINKAGRFEENIRRLSQAIRWAPLDWQLYTQRGAARAYAGQWTGALADFRCARRLEPFLPDVPLVEGRVWLGVRPTLALPAWHDALRRAAPASAPNLYASMIAMAPAEPRFRDPLRAMSDGRLSLQLVYLKSATPAEAGPLIRAIRDRDPQLETLSGTQKSALFSAWMRSPERAELFPLLEQKGSWRAAGWRHLARHYAEEKDFARACETVFTYLEIPVVPRSAPTRDGLGELRRRALTNPADFASAYALYLAELQAGRTGDALATLERTGSQPARPAYFPYLTAKLRAGRGEWSEAWAALSSLLSGN